MKKIITVIIFILITVLFYSAFNITAAAKETNNAELRYAANDLDKEVDGQLDNINTEEIDGFLKTLSEFESSVFGKYTFKEKVKSIINGDFKIGYDNLFSALLGLFFSEIFNLLPLFSVILLISVLCGLLKSVNSDFIKEGTGNVIFLVCYCAVLILVLTLIIPLINNTLSTIKTLVSQMNVIMPILLTLMAASGGTVSAKVYSPAAVFLSNGIVNIIISAVFPLLMLILTFSIVGNISGNIKLNNFIAFFKSVIKWLLGILLTVFTVFLSVQGITSASFDGISVKAAKYAVGNSIPIIGNFLKDGFDLILAGSILIKNSIGSVAILLIAVIIFFPLIAIIAVSLLMRLTAGVTEVIADSKITGFLTSTANMLNYLVAALLCAGFMYFITIMLFIISSNSIL